MEMSNMEDALRKLGVSPEEVQILNEHRMVMARVASQCRGHPGNTATAYMHALRDEKIAERYAWLATKGMRAAPAAAREEAKAGRGPVAEKAGVPVSTAPRLNDGDSGHTQVASNGQVGSAASPSSKGDGKGQGADASYGRSVFARPSPPIGDDRSQPRSVGNDHPCVAPSSPPRPTAEAGHTQCADKGQTSSARPAVVKPATLPVKTERVPLHGQKNESDADVEAKKRVMRGMGELLAPTFKVYDNRDMADVGAHEVGEIDRRNVVVLRNKAEDIRKHLVMTFAVREVLARIGVATWDKGATVEAIIPRAEIRAIWHKNELRVAAMGEVAVDAAARELRAFERGADASVALFGETIKLIGAGANA